jgi:hypothetical protein
MSSEVGLRMTHISALARLVTLRQGTPDKEGTLVELRDVYATFTEGFGTSQLLAAKAVLEAT